MKRSWLWIGSLVLFFPLIFSALASAQQAVGVVTALKGKAQLTRAATQTALRFKDDLILRDLIDTQEKSLTRVLFGGKSTVTVRELSRLEVREELLPGGRTRSIHELSSGSILVNVARSLMRRGDEVQIRTPNAIAAVRGSTIFAEYIPGLAQSIFIIIAGSGEITPIRQAPIVRTTLTKTIITGTQATGVDVVVETITQAEADKILEESEVRPTRTEESAEAQLQEASQLMAALLGELPAAAIEIVPLDLGPDGFYICKLCDDVSRRSQELVRKLPFTFKTDSTSSEKAPFFQVTNETIDISDNLIQVNSDVDVSLAGQLLEVDPSTVDVGNHIVKVNPGASLNLGGALFSDVNGTIGANVSLLEVDNGTVTGTGPGSFVQFDGTTVDIGNRVIGLQNGGSVTVAGPVVDMTLVNLDIPGGSLVRLTGGSTLTNTAGPVIKISDGSLTANAIATTDGAGNSFNLTGTLLDLSNNANVTLETLLSEPAGSTDSFTFNLETGKPFVKLASSTLKLIGEGKSLVGTFNVDANSTLEFAGGVHTLDGFTFEGGGTAQITSGAVNTAGAGATIDAGTLALSGGVLGGSGPMTVSGAFNWTGGTITGTGAFTVSSPLNISDSFLKVLSGRTLTNAGAANWTGAGDISIEQGGKLLNTGTGIFDVKTDADIVAGTGGGTVDNQGKFLKSAGTDPVGTVVFAAFDNLGTVEVKAGTLSLSGPVTGGGDYTVAAGGTLQFSPSTPATLGGTVDVTGAGTVRFSSGTATIDGTYNITGSTEFTGGDVTFNPAATLTSLSSGPLAISGGTVTFNSGEIPINVTTLGLSGGTLAGSDDITVSGPFDWSGGTITGTGAFTVSSPLNISGSSIKVLSERTLENAGAATWTDAGNINSGQGAVFNNLASGTFNVQNDSFFSFNLGGTATEFNNLGLFTKSAGTGATTFSNVVFNNTGTVEVQTGTLSLTGGGTSSGDFIAGTGATLIFGGGIHNLGGGSSLAGSGTVSVTSGTVNFSGTYNLSGTTSVTGGSLSAPSSIATLGADLTLGGAFLSQSGGSVSAGADVLAVGANTLNSSATPVFDLTGGTLTANNLASVAGGNINLGGALLSMPSGTPTVTLSGDVLNIASAVTGPSSGSLFSVAAGSLTASGDLVDLATGSTLNLSDSLLTVSGGSVSVANVIDLGASLTTPTGQPLLQVTSGSLSATSSLAAQGADLTLGGAFLSQSGGTVSAGADALAVGANTLTSSSTAVFDLTGGTLTITGTGSDLVNVSGGSSGQIITGGDLLQVSNGSTVTINDGVIINAASGGIVLIPGAAVELDNIDFDTVNINNSIVSTDTINGIPVRKTNGAFISLGPNTGLGDVTVPAGFSVISADGAGTLVTIDPVLLPSSSPVLTIQNKPVPLLTTNLANFSPGVSESVDTAGDFIVATAFPNQGFAQLGTDPVISISNSTVTLVSKAIVSLSGTSLAIPGPLLKITGGSIKTLFSGDGTLLSVSSGSILKTFGTVPLIQIDSSTVDIADEAFSLDGIVSLGGPLLTATDSPITSLFEFLILDGTLTSTTTQALFQFTNSPVKLFSTGDFIDINGTMNLSGPLLNATNSDFLDQDSLVVIDGNLTSTSTSPLVSISGGTHSVSDVFFVSGSTIDPVTGLGTDQPLTTGGAVFEATNGATITSSNALDLDTALLEASAPIISLIGTTTPADTTLTTSSSTLDLFKSKVISLGPVIALDKGLINVTNGPLINLTSGSNMTVTGDLLSLINASKINVVNGPLIKVDGVSGTGVASLLDVTGALVNFGGTGGNQIIIKNDIVSTGSRGGPANDLFTVDVTGAGSSITIGSNPVKNSVLGSITVTKKDGSAGGVLIQATGGGVVNIAP